METTHEAPLSERGYRPLLPLAKACTAVFAVYLALIGGYALMLWNKLGHLQTPRAERDFEALRAMSDRASSLKSFTWGLIVLCVAVFCFWTYRLVKNARLVDEGELPTPGMAVGYYFIPVVCLYKPLVTMRAAWRVSDPAARAPLLLGAWWLSVLVSRGMAYVVEKTVDNKTDADVERFIELALVVCCLELLVVGLALAMIWKLSRRFDVLAASPVPAARVRQP